ncbi:MAG: helix-turn-helix transcriptional regulator [Mycobacterium sp.]
MKRQVDYTWRLAELMAARGMHNTTDLIPLLVDRGIQLSRPQVYRVVNQRPERVSLQLIAALCDILSCGVDDLLTVTATDVRRRKVSSSSQTAPTPNVVELNKAVRPRRARVISDDD